MSLRSLRIVRFKFVWILLAGTLVVVWNLAAFSQADQTQTPSAPAAVAPQTRSQSLERTAWKVLKQGMAEEKSSDKIAVITALGSIGPQREAVRLTERGLSDSDPDVRLAAASALGQMKARSAIPKLRRLLRDPKPEVSFAAAKALWIMGDRSGRDVFVEVLAGERSASPGMLDAAKKHYLNPRTLALTGVQEGAGALFGPLGFGVSALRELAKDKGAPARALSAEMLSLDHSRRALAALQDAAADKNWVVRAAAAEALGNSGQRGALPTLRLLLNDDKAAVRSMAAASIIRLHTHQPQRIDIARLPYTQQY